jgi:hypothetical protein
MRAGGFFVFGNEAGFLRTNNFSAH